MIKIEEIKLELDSYGMDAKDMTVRGLTAVENFKSVLSELNIKIAYTNKCYEKLCKILMKEGEPLDNDGSTSAIWSYLEQTNKPKPIFTVFAFDYDCIQTNVVVINELGNEYLKYTTHPIDQYYAQEVGIDWEEELINDVYERLEKKNGIKREDIKIRLIFY